jgi:hypothetical protein
VTIASGHATINCKGIPGTVYLVKRATSVTGPWTTVDTITAPTPDGQFSYTDPTAIAGQTEVFYELVQQP